MVQGILCIIWLRLLLLLFFLVLWGKVRERDSREYKRDSREYKEDVARESVAMHNHLKARLYHSLINLPSAVSSARRSVDMARDAASLHSTTFSASVRKDWSPMGGPQPPEYFYLFIYLFWC